MIGYYVAKGDECNFPIQHTKTTNLPIIATGHLKDITILTIVKPHVRRKSYESIRVGGVITISYAVKWFSWMITVWFCSEMSDYIKPNLFTTTPFF